MARHRVPTARFVVAETEADALAAARSGSLGWPLVVKADGLAAGKGVVVASDLAEAEATIRDMMSLGRFGAAGARVVLEEFLTGPEASFFVLTDGDARDGASARRRITSACSTTTAGRTREGWARSRRVRWWTRRWPSA